MRNICFLTKYIRFLSPLSIIFAIIAKTSTTMENCNYTPTRFIDLTLDYGFKIVFEDREHPELMIGFLNAVITDRNIISITFLNTEPLPFEEEDKRPNYDISCTDDEGNHFLVEIQKKMYREYGDRLLVYTGDPLTRILKRGEAYSKVRTLYVVSILDGYIKVKGEDRPVRDKLLREAHVMMDGGTNILSDKLNFLFLQLPAVKAVTEESTFLERWAWYVKHIHELNRKPEGLSDYFSLLFDAADRKKISSYKLSNYDRMQRDEIQIEAEKRYAVEEAREDALAEGEAKGAAAKQREVARVMLAKNFPVDVIASVTGLSEEQVRDISKPL